MQRHFLLLFAAMAVYSFSLAQTNTFPSTGNVGIGTTSPQQRLHVEGPTNLSVFVSTSPLSNISGSGMIGYTKFLPTAAGQRLGYFLLGSRGGAQNNYHAAGMVGYAAGPWTAGSSYPAYLALETTPSGSSTRAERLRITENGYVGIGTQDPQYILDVRSPIGATVARITSDNSHALLVLNKLVSTKNEYVSHQTGGVSTWTEGTIGNNNFSLYNWQLNKEALTVDIANNNIGIGTTTPTNKFVVTNSSTTSTAVIQNLRNSTFGNHGMEVKAGSDHPEGPSDMIAFRRPDNGLLGSIWQASTSGVAYSTSSDKRLKTNIRATRFGLADVNKIQVKDYNFTGSKEEQTGFLAQQLYEVFPDAVAVGGDNPKERPWMVDYGRLTPLLVKGMQELSKENEALREELTELREMVMELKSERTTAHFPGAYLEQARPNPASVSTTIIYGVPNGTSSARLILTNAKGQVIKQLSISGRGVGQMNLNTTSLAAGVYIYTLWINGQQADSKQLVIAR